jgi:3,4-dihydroxy 2-butanone 4-phosphate synthase/GTP cyclohydrolase II
MARRPALFEFAREHELPIITVRQIAQYRRRVECGISAGATSRLPTRYGMFTAHAYRGRGGDEHLALVMGDPAGAMAPLVRVHSECLTGDVLGSLRCDCGTQLADGLRAIAEKGEGVLIYLQGHEGRGIGLTAKVAAYALQERGYDTVDANLALGLPADGRDYGDAAAILHDLGVQRVRLLTNNPAKTSALDGAGIEVVEQVPLPATVTPDNIAYLQTKNERMGHRIQPLGAARADTRAM